MKKILALAVLAASLAGVSAFAQGNFVFQSGSRYVWDNWSGVAVPTPNFTNNVAFLWGSGTPSVDSIATSVPTNNMVSGAVTLSQTAWTDILTDSNFHLATNSSTSALIVVQTSAVGGYSYNAGSSVAVAGTSSGGGSTTVYVIGWDVHYATPQLASAAGAALGWSVPFTYNYANSSTQPTSFSAQVAEIKFGVSPIGAVPEPSTFALAGLGAAALMIFRRKK